MKKTLLMVIIMFVTIFTYSQTDTTTIWNGYSNSSWEKSTNWTNGVPDPTMDAIIDASVNQPEISADAECHDLIINQGSYLKIGLNPGLTSHLIIYGNLDICADSGLIIKEKNFVTVHDTTYIGGNESIKLLSYKHGVGIQQRIFTASFINYDTIIYENGGTIESEVYMVNGSDSGSYYIHQVGPLVTNPSFSSDSVYGQPGVYLQDFNIRPYGTYAYTYNEPTDLWINIHPFPLPVPTTSGILLSTVDGIDYPLKMVGKFYYGDITIDPSTGIEYSNFNITPPQQLVNMGQYTKLGSGYNLISNPYPSSVNWDTLYDLNSGNLSNKIYVWNPKFQNYGVYVAHTSGTLDVTENISLGQAFFVETTMENPTFTFYDNARTHSIDPFVKAETLYSLKVRIIGDDLGDECAINFNDNATYGYDSEYDSYKWESWNSISPEIRADDLTISSIPFGGTSVNLFTECNVSGDYYIETTGAESFENYKVLLEDIETGSIIDLEIENTYNFTSGIVPFENRFIIHFDIDTYVNEINHSDVKIYSYNKNIYIDGEVDNVIITNILGQKIYEGNKTHITIKSSGTYIVTVLINNFYTVRKVQIF